MDTENLQVLARYNPSERQTNPPLGTLGLSGAYVLLTRNHEFLVARQNWVEIYSDDTETNTLQDRSADIRLVTRYEIPLCSEEDAIAGITMLYTGELFAVSEKAGVVVLTDYLSNSTDGVVTYFGKCETGVTVSNNVATDAQGGIYVVTDEHIIKFSWHQDTRLLDQEWQVEYRSSPQAQEQAIRLGPGSGSTPSLMGTKLSDDHFVVITDGQLPMHLFLAWRDEIPEDWEGIGQDRDRRIACEVPVTFGLMDPTKSLSEQSVLVRGYGAALVNDYLDQDRPSTGRAVDNLFAALDGSNPQVTTPGVQRIDWDPESRTCRTKWTNPTVTSPNGIPTMSSSTRLMYVIAQRQGRWGLSALDWETGEEANFWEPPVQNCSDAVLDQLQNSVLSVTVPIVESFPQTCENSVYAATEVGPDDSIYTGTLLGVTRYAPTPRLSDYTPHLSDLADLVGVGLDQCIDIVDRGVLQPFRGQEFASRGVVQMQMALERTEGRLCSNAVDGKTVEDYILQAISHFLAASMESNDTTAVLADLEKARFSCQKAMEIRPLEDCNNRSRTEDTASGGTKLIRKTAMIIAVASWTFQSGLWVRLL